MYSLARRNRPLQRIVTTMFAFVYAYFGFVAALHHTDGVIPTGKALVFSALTCPHTHAQLSSDSASSACGVCDFQSSLVSAAIPIDSGQVPEAASTPVLSRAQDLCPQPCISYYSSRAPPFLA